MIHDWELTLPSHLQLWLPYHRDGFDKVTYGTWRIISLLTARHKFPTWFSCVFTMFHHVSPCFTMFHHVSPCFTMFHHVSPCFTPKIQALLGPGLRTSSSPLRWLQLLLQRRTGCWKNGLLGSKGAKNTSLLGAARHWPIHHDSLWVNMV